MKLQKICIFLYPMLVMSSVMAQKKPINVLIVDGFSNHDWKQTSKLTKQILEESKLFKVAISTIPSDSTIDNWNPRFEKYELVIQNTNNIQAKILKWPGRIEAELENYVRNGGGLYILHSANNAFPHWKEYDKMIGLGWRGRETGFALEIDENKNIIRIPPGEGNNTGHGKRFDATIQILNNHPINSGFPNEWKTPSMEVYTYPRGPAENLTVLSFAYDSVSTQKKWPVEWVVKYGKGRVYNSSMGHLWKDELYPVSYRCVGFQTTMIRVAEWLAGGKVTYKVPGNFPSKESISVRDESDYPK